MRVVDQNKCNINISVYNFHFLVLKKQQQKMPTYAGRCGWFNIL